jgi:L-alanine-DL-glutamate epimerase-like enolase superfamily enzyme
MKHTTRIGFRHYKVKVTGDVAADIAFVKAVREHLRSAGPADCVIRLDGNQGYSAESYRRMLDELQRAKIEIELFEQPLAADDFAGLRTIAGCSPVPVILDETVFDAEACRRVVDERLGDGVNIKIAKSGIAGSAAILKCARAAGLKLMIGCMTETMVGLSAGIYMAAGTAAFDYVDLDAAHLLFNARRYGDIEIAGRRYLIDGAERVAGKGGS